MDTNIFFLALLGAWLVLRTGLWHRANRAALRRIKSGETEFATEQSRKQPLIFVATFLISVVEILRFSPEVHPALTYSGLVLWCLGLAMLTKELHTEGSRWTERIFAKEDSSENPGSLRPNRKPWLPGWPLRLESVGIALFCGAPVAALTAGVFCTAYARGIQSVFSSLED
jgi:isoprenylcysteine carboxyl methyltransferase (ICMT) family protein YpbQ